MTRVDVVDVLVPALEPETEAAVEDYLDVRDIALTQLLEVESCMRVDVEPSNFGLEV